jgi:predicted transposase/invertase (TIGR01784 family)
MFNYNIFVKILTSVGCLLLMSSSWLSASALRDDEDRGYAPSSSSSSAPSSSSLSRKRDRTEISDSLSSSSSVPSSSSSSSSQSSKVLNTRAGYSSSDLDELSDESSDESDDEFRDQEYSSPTSDKTFKLFMTNPNVARSFLRVFVPDPSIQIVDQMSEHLNSLNEFQRARKNLHSKKYKGYIARIKDLLKKGIVKDEAFYTGFIHASTGENVLVKGGAYFTKSFVDIYNDILRGYPRPSRNAQVDYVCLVDNSYYAVVEIQVVHQSYWDERALNSAASLYAHQLREGDKYKDIKKVVCINIIGDGSEVHMWPGKRHFQHFRFQDQHGTLLEKGIEIIQYPLGQDETFDEAIEKLSEPGKIEFREWWEFLAHADKHKKEMVAQVQTPEVREAYELVRFSNLSPNRRAKIIRRKQYWDLYKDQTKAHIKKWTEKGREEGKKDTARRLITMGLSDEQILHVTELPLEEVRALRESSLRVVPDAA